MSNTRESNSLSIDPTFPLAATVFAYLIYDYVEKEHDRLMRKQPGEFDHET